MTLFSSELQYEDLGNIERKLGILVLGAIDLH